MRLLTAIASTAVLIGLFAAVSGGSGGYGGYPGYGYGGYQGGQQSQYAMYTPYGLAVPPIGMPQWLLGQNQNHPWGGGLGIVIFIGLLIWLFSVNVTG